MTELNLGPQRLDITARRGNSAAWRYQWPAGALDGTTWVARALPEGETPVALTVTVDELAATIDVSLTSTQVDALPTVTPIELVETTGGVDESRVDHLLVLRAIGSTDEVTDEINVTTGTATVTVTVLGPVGPSGSSGDIYTHTQSTPGATWTVNHNRGHYPVSTVVVGGDQLVADITHPTVNQSVLTFPAPTAGTATFI